MMDLRSQTCCFTGHRNIPMLQLGEVIGDLEKVVIKAIDSGYRYFGAGGAQGFDTLAANTVLKLKEKYPHIRLILVLPCKGQTQGWPEDAKKEYERILQKADKVVYVSEHYTRSCMHMRNRHLVDYSSLCICYLEKDSGGTAYTVYYAKKEGLQIINIAK